jgi:hypothetical protein
MMSGFSENTALHYDGGCVKNRPCAGKTTVLTDLATSLPSLGLNVICVPELATLFFKGGAAFPVGTDATRSQQLGWDHQKLTAQIALEDSFRAIAEQSGKPTVILCDRGAMDTKAFCSTEDEHEHGGASSSSSSTSGSSNCAGGELNYTGSNGGGEWGAILRKVGVDEERLLRRYDAVIHMASSAIGAEPFYLGLSRHTPQCLSGSSFNCTHM